MSKQKNFICTLESGGQYEDRAGFTRHAVKGRPITDAAMEKMMLKSKDAKGNDVVAPRYGFEVYDGPIAGSNSTAETAREMKRLATQNEEFKTENDELRAKLAKLEKSDKD